MEYQLEERTRDMQDMLESCQTKVCLCVSSVLLSPGQAKALVVLTCTNGISPNHLLVIVASYRP